MSRKDDEKTALDEEVSARRAAEGDRDRAVARAEAASASMLEAITALRSARDRAINESMAAREARRMAEEALAEAQSEAAAWKERCERARKTLREAIHPFTPAMQEWFDAALADDPPEVDR